MLCTYSIKIVLIAFLSFLFSLIPPYFIIAGKLPGISVRLFWAYVKFSVVCVFDVSCVLVAAAYLVCSCTAALGVNRLSVWCSLWYCYVRLWGGGAVEYGRRLILIFTEVVIY
jgi:hypothetical protein